MLKIGVLALQGAFLEHERERRIARIRYMCRYDSIGK